jgi:hypothetical protein
MVLTCDKLYDVSSYHPLATCHLSEPGWCGLYLSMMICDIPKVSNLAYNMSSSSSDLYVCNLHVILLLGVQLSACMESMWLPRCYIPWRSISNLSLNKYLHLNPEFWIHAFTRSNQDLPLVHSICFLQ